MDPAAVAETYRYLYEGEKRMQARRLEALVCAELDEEGQATARWPRRA